MKRALNEREERILADFARELVDQQAARVIVRPQKPASGFWFGGGNMIEGPDGELYLAGRYRNHGDSRTGLHLGQRGLELAIFCSRDRGGSFEKILAFSKDDLSHSGRQVLSIEGSALHWTAQGVELFVSCEKSGIDYPRGFERFKKPGTGVWTIDHLQAATIEGLASSAIGAVIDRAGEREFTHCKDPFAYTDGDNLVLLFCTHPYNWSSSNTALAVREAPDEGLTLTLLSDDNFNALQRTLLLQFALADKDG